MENLKRKIKVLGTELLMDTKKKVKDLQVQEEQHEKASEKKWQEKIENKLAILQKFYDVEIDHIEKKNEADFQLKEQLALLELKNKLLAEVKSAIIERIRTQIEANYSEYIEFIQKEILVDLNKLCQNSTISLNDRDKKYFTTKGLPKSAYQISIGNKKLNIIGGFELEAADLTMMINFTIEDLLAKQEEVLLTEFNRLIQPDLA